MPKIGAQFEFKSPKANFARDQYDTLDEMKLVNAKEIDQGHIAYCTETNLHYIFNPNNEYDDKNGYWTKMVSTEDYITLVNTLQTNTKNITTNTKNITKNAANIAELTTSLQTAVVYIGTFDPSTGKIVSLVSAWDGNEYIAVGYSLLDDVIWSEIGESSYVGMLFVASTSGTWDGRTYGMGDSILLTAAPDEEETMPKYITLQTNVESRIAKNAADIATNKTAITQNASDIATNKANISKNAADIATNTANIAQNASDIADTAERISKDEEQIAGNTLGISANRALINTNTENLTNLTNSLKSAAYRDAEDSAINLTSDDTKKRLPTSNVVSNFVKTEITDALEKSDALKCIGAFDPSTGKITYLIPEWQEKEYIQEGMILDRDVDWGVYYGYAIGRWFFRADSAGTWHYYGGSDFEGDIALEKDDFIIFIDSNPNDSGYIPDFIVLHTGDTPYATSTETGLVKLGSDTVQSVAANAVTATAGKTYAVQKNSNQQLVVNVPWSDTIYTLPLAAANRLGGIKVDYGDVDNYETGNYQAGLRLDEQTDQAYVQLPYATSTNGGLMQMEDYDTLQTNTEDIATNTKNIATNTANIATLLNSAYTEDTLSYGVERDLTVSSPTCTRIGNMSLHKTLPIHSKMRGCLLDDNGKVVEYLDAKDWTSATRDGSRGQVMVEIPMHYRKFTLDGNVYSVRISEVPLPGYHQVPKMYISAYEAALDRTNNKLASVVNTTAQYRGGGNNADWDDTYRTLLGRPATAISRTNFRKYARNRNAAATSEWNCLTYDAYKAVYWLFVIEYATLNSQADYTAELTTEGYHQGGLGAGVTNWDVTNWATFNNHYPFVPCGHTDSLGNQTGTVAYTAVDADGAELYTPQVPRYRGIENPFGHIWKWCDGINIRSSPNVADGGDGLSKVYVCSDPSLFSDTGYDGYNYVGDEARGQGNIKNIIGGEYGEIISSEMGGGSTTYYCDYHYTNIPATETLRGVVFGGLASYGATAGLACAYSHYAPSSAAAYFGSRLCFIPE